MNELSYNEVVGHFGEHYTLPVNETTASYAFLMQAQKAGETIQDFIAEIRLLAEKCDFRAWLERMLRD